MHEENNKLMTGERLLETVFDENSRPSMRWLRTQQKARTIPSVRIGRLIFFNPDQVRIALENKTTRRT